MVVVVVVVVLFCCFYGSNWLLVQQASRLLIPLEYCVQVCFHSYRPDCYLPRTKEREERRIPRLIFCKGTTKERLWMHTTPGTVSGLQGSPLHPCTFYVTPLSVSRSSPSKEDRFGLCIYYKLRVPFFFIKKRVSSIDVALFFFFATLCL